MLSALAGEPSSGVRQLSGREVSSSPASPPAWASLLSDLRVLRRDDLPDGFASGWAYTAPAVNMPVYLEYLLQRYAGLGGSVSAETVTSLASVQAPVVVNCTGIGARSLVPDPAVVPVRVFADDHYLLFATRKGVVKKTALSADGNIRTVGLNTISVREGDELIGVQITSGDDEVILATRQGMAIRFHESDARSMGRVTEGVRGISLEVPEGSVVAVLGANGAGKTTTLRAVSGTVRRSGTIER